MSGYGRIDKLPTEINAGWFQLEASYAAYSPAQPSQIISNGRFLVKLGTLPPFYNSGGSVNKHFRIQLARNYLLAKIHFLP